MSVNYPIEIEDEAYFILKCPKFDNIRNKCIVLFKKTILVLKYFKYPRPRNSQHEAN
jgi:hypothetical protein